MDFLYLFRVLLRKKWTILFFSILAAVGAFTLISFKKDLYESVSQYSTGFTADKVKLAEGTVTVDIYTLDIKFNNVIETFRSPRVIGMLSYKLMLHDLESPGKAFRKLTEKEKSKEAYKAVSADTIIKVLTNKIVNFELLATSENIDRKIIEYLKLYSYDYDGLKKTLNIRRVERTDYIDIVFQSENPFLSAFVVNTLGTEFINYYKNLNNQRNTESAANIQTLLSVQQQKVDSLTTELKIARTSQGPLSAADQGKYAVETTKELQVQYSTAQNEYNLQSRLYESYDQRIKLLRSTLNSNTSQNTLALFQRRDELREAIAKSPNPDPALVSEFNSIDGQIKSLSTTSRTKTQNELLDLQTKADDAKARMNAASATILQLTKLINASKNVTASPKTEVEIEAINRQLEIENNELKTLREKLSQAQGVIQDDPTSSFKKTLVGEPDIKPIPKRRILITGLAGISACVIAALIFLMQEIFSNSIKTPSQFRKLIDLPLKGVLNLFNLKTNSIEELMMNDFSDNQLKKEALFKTNIKKIRHEIDISESKAFLFTSTGKGTGKTLVIQSLAYSFLLSNKKVLLIDLNFENNSLSRIFNTSFFIEDIISDFAPKPEYIEPASIGDEETINQDQPLLTNTISRKDVQSYSKITSTISNPYRNLYVLGCHQGSYSPSEVIPLNFFSRLITEMKKKFDYIFIESSSLNNRSDSYELFDSADSVITVFSAKSSPSQADFKSLESIHALNEKNFGAILNQVEYNNMNF